MARGSVCHRHNNNINYSHHALINALSTHMIQINLNTMFYTHTEQSPTNAMYIKYQAKTNKKQVNAMNSNHLYMHEFSNHTPFGTAQWGDWFHQWTGSSKVANTLMYQALSQCQSKHQLPSPSLYKTSAVPQSASTVTVSA